VLEDAVFGFRCSDLLADFGDVASELLVFLREAAKVLVLTVLGE
jgi:hypothetical protein